MIDANDLVAIGQHLRQRCHSPRHAQLVATRLAGLEVTTRAGTPRINATPYRLHDLALQRDAAGGFGFGAPHRHVIG